MRLINADEFVNEIYKCVMYDGNTACVDKYEVIHRLNNVPTIEAEPIRQGKWIWYYGPGRYYCSECGFCADGYAMECIDGIFKFCPKCGAKIVGVEDEELPDSVTITFKKRR